MPRHTVNERDFGPWVRFVVRPFGPCYICGDGIPTGAHAFFCERTGRIICGPCGVPLIVKHHNEKREGVKT